MTPDKTVLITGASSGIGLSAAVAASAAGWRTVATMRDVSRAQQLRDAADAAGVGDRLEVSHLDVNNSSSVAACVAGVIAAHGRLDALIPWSP